MEIIAIWAVPIYGPGLAHIWALAKPNMGPAHGPGPWGRARALAPAYLGENFFQNSILKNLDIPYIIEC